MQIFNTLTRQKEEFVPQVPGEYRIYVCGPTVYNYIHIGNARPLIVFDTLRRYLEYRGNKVIYVSNITDIDDKLIKKGQEEGTSMKEVAQRFEAEYLKDAAGLNCEKPTVQPRATEHIPQILDIVKDLIDSGHAYVAKNGDVYFRVKSDPGYGKLSHLNLDDLDDLTDMLGCAGAHGGGLDVQTVRVLDVLGLKLAGNLLHGGAVLLAFFDQFIVNIGDIGDIQHLVAKVLQIAAQRVKHDHGARIADMDIVIHRRAADVNAINARLLRDKIFLFAGHGIKNLHGQELPFPTLLVRRG